MKYVARALLVFSVVLLTLIFLINDHSILGLYYVVWTIICGGLFLMYRPYIEHMLRAWHISSGVKFILLGIVMIVLEEVIAGIAMHGVDVQSTPMLVVGVAQFLAFNLLALPGFVIGWYVLLRNIAFREQEVFFLAGCFGLFAEKIYMHILTIPVMGLLLILPTMYTYALIIAPSVVGTGLGSGKQVPPFLRYVLGCAVPIIVSIPFVLLLTYLKLHFPDAFPAEGLTA